MDVEKTMEFILEQLAHVAALQAQAEERQNRMDRRLSRAIRLVVVEARRESARRRELEDRMEQARQDAERAHQETEQTLDRLAAAQLVTEEKLQRFLEWRSGPNGKG